MDTAPTPAPIPFQDFVRLESVDPAKNRARFFVLAWQPTLWGERVLVRVWGRCGTLGRWAVVKTSPAQSPEQIANRLLQLRLRHGYAITAWR